MTTTAKNLVRTGVNLPNALLSPGPRPNSPSFPLLVFALTASSNSDFPMFEYTVIRKVRSLLLSVLFNSLFN